MEIALCGPCPLASRAAFFESEGSEAAGMATAGLKTARTLDGALTTAESSPWTGALRFEDASALNRTVGFFTKTVLGVALNVLVSLMISAILVATLGAVTVAVVALITAVLASVAVLIDHRMRGCPDRRGTSAAILGIDGQRVTGSATS
jgi:hypothetical protein